MAAYATAADAIARYGTDYVTVSCDRAGDGTLDEAAFALALEDASDWIDSYLSGRVGLPLASPPRRLIRICIDVAIFESSETAGTMTTQKEDRFKRALTFMERVAEGKQRLTLDAVDVAGRNASQSATTVTQAMQAAERIPHAREFARDTLRKL